MIAKTRAPSAPSTEARSHRSRVLTPVNGVLILLLAGTVVALCWRIPAQAPTPSGGQPPAPSSGPARTGVIPQALLPDVAVNTGVTPRQPAPPGSVPINSVDPMTGKPVGLGAPAALYKGRIIGFCCTASPAYQGGWDRMKEADKDAFVARFAG